MTQYSLHEQELETKIHAFISKKMKEFPELEDERFYIERPEPIEKRDAVSRRQILPVMRLNTQY